MQRRIHHPPPTLVVASIALLVSLGGTSYATVLNVPKNSVGTPQLRSNAVTTPKVKNNAITTAKVRNRSLLAADFAPGQLPQGSQGPAGAQGPAGPAGPRGAVGHQALRAQTASNSTSTKQISANCPEGKRATGGSVRLFGFTADVALTASSGEGPDPAAPTQWFASAREVGAGTAASWGLRVDVICMDVG